MVVIVTMAVVVMVVAVNLLPAVEFRKSVIFLDRKGRKCGGLFLRCGGVYRLCY